MYKIRFKTGRFALISIFVLIFQTTLLNLISIGELKPDLILLTLLFYCVYQGPKQGMICGLIFGLFMDSLSSGLMGINILAYGLVGCLSGMLKDHIYTNHILTKIFLPFLAGCVFNLVYYCIASVFYRIPQFSESWMLLFGALYYAALINVFYFEILDKFIATRTMNLS